MIIISIILGLKLILIIWFFNSNISFNNTLKLFITLLIKKVYFFFKNIIKILLVNRKRLKRSSSTMLPTKTKNDEDLGNFKMFEFVRIRCARKDFQTGISSSFNLSYLFDDQYQNEYQNNRIELDETPENNDEEKKYKFGIPKKRSGHRAVCNEENLWIWGGYCPVNELRADNDEDEEVEYPDSPLFAEVCE